MATGGDGEEEISRVFWIRLEDRSGGLSEPFRVKFSAPPGTPGGWKGALVEDLKEQMLEQHSSLFLRATATGAAPPLPWVSLWTPRGTPVQGGDEEVKLSPSGDLGSLPEGAGTASLCLTALVNSKAAEPSPPQGKGRPPTLFEQGLADVDEPEQIKNATDLRELYPGGKLPRTTSQGSSCSKCCKVIMIFGTFFLFAFCLTYILSVPLPEFAGYPVAVPSPNPGLKKPSLEALLLGHQRVTQREEEPAREAVWGVTGAGSTGASSAPEIRSDGGNGGVGSHAAALSGHDGSEL